MTDSQSRFPAPGPHDNGTRIRISSSPSVLWIMEHGESGVDRLEIMLMAVPLLF